MSTEAWRAVLAALAAFAIAVLIGPTVITYLRRLRIGQNIRQEGPKEHLKKAGTPVMGGVIIQLAAVLSVLLISSLDEPTVVVLIMMIGFGIIGLLDDYLIVVAKRSLGLKARHKLLGQIMLGLFLALYVLTKSEGVPLLLVPFTGYSIQFSPLLYIVVVVTVIVGSANAVNLTDGLDGLAAGTSAIAFTAYALLSLALGWPSLALFSSAVVGGCVGFIWFNAHPAQVFMGDTGSLALGGALGTLAVLTDTALFLPIVGGVFVIETLSVVTQVTYFRLTRGKRVFRMSPLHHHFELGGWAEPKIVTRFWILGLVFSVLGLAGMLTLF